LFASGSRLSNQSVQLLSRLGLRDGGQPNGHRESLPTLMSLTPAESRMMSGGIRDLLFIALHKKALCLDSTSVERATMRRFGFQSRATRVPPI
jgi:hypothetical protein